jgi:hypothetical protein
MIRITDKDGFLRDYDEIVAEILRTAVEYYQGQIFAVVKDLNIPRSTFYRMLDQYHINPNAFRGERMPDKEVHRLRRQRRMKMLVDNSYQLL